jgi:myosin heavy subunit
VKYDACGFVDKNRDEVPPSSMELLVKSQSFLVADLFRAKRTSTGDFFVVSSHRKRACWMEHAVVSDLTCGDNFSQLLN